MDKKKSNLQKRKEKICERIEGTPMELPLAMIDVSGRFREDMGDIDDLAESIKEVGLIHPPTVLQINGERGEVEGYKLLAGGRRYEALRKLRWKTATFNVYDRPLEDWEIRKIELLENDKRKEMTWHERDKLVTEYHRLMGSVQGIHDSRGGSGATGHTVKSTAEAFNISPTHAKRHLNMYKEIENLPEDLRKLVTSQPTANAARKVLDQVKKTANDAASSIALQEEVEKTGGLEASLIKSYIVGDFFKEVKRIGTGTVDLVEIDPPYAIDITKLRRDRNRGVNSAAELHYNEVDRKEYPKFLDATLREAARVMRPDSWLILWHASEYIDLCRSMMEKYEFKFGRPAIWAKPSGETMNPSIYLGSSWEGFFYARKGQPVVAKQGRNNIFSYTQPSGHTRIHPTERPVELIEDILTTFVGPGSFVLVPFAGSGNTIRAAYNVGMKAIGYDLSGYYRPGYIARLKQSK